MIYLIVSKLFCFVKACTHNCIQYFSMLSVMGGVGMYTINIIINLAILIHNNKSFIS